MRVVDRPHCRPMHCAATPFIGQTTGGRWIDTGSELPGFDNHVYLHETSVYEAAKLLGYPDRSEHRQLKAELKDAQARITELEADLESERRFHQAVDVIESADFRARRKAGRPAKEPA